MSRESIYYWKCDRASAFRPQLAHDPGEIETELRDAIRARLGDDSARLAPFHSQGNHAAWLVHHGGGTRTSFLRVETGPEQDDYMEVESHLLDQVRSELAPTPGLVACDATRETVPFAWQLIEYLDQPSLQNWHKNGQLDLEKVSWQIGRAIADFQTVAVSGFGPFQTSELRASGTLRGYHNTYRDYFFLNFEEHLEALSAGGFLSAAERDRIAHQCHDLGGLLALEKPCLVHKDMALWNLLGTEDRLTGIIDWDDAIAGDPVDDLALLGCFFDASVLEPALAGYETIRPRPENFEPRFWLHVLRNLIFKAVIRLRGGYFDRGDDFFLIAAGADGESFREETRHRLLNALTELESPTLSTTLS